MGTAGRDFGPYAEWLDANCISRKHIRVIEDEFTAQAFITTDLDDNQITAFHPGAMSYSHLNRVTDADGVTAGIVSPDGREGMLQHAQQFAEAGIPFIFDPGQGIPLFNGEELRRFIELARWVTVNDYEWQLLSERTGLDVSTVAERVEALIITRGAAGSEIHTVRERIHIPAAKPAAMADPTGCGDAYRAGLLYGLVQDMDWQTTGRIASLLGAIKIAAPGTQNHRIAIDEFREKFRENFGYAF
jgi:adenosine kinase